MGLHYFTKTLMQCYTTESLEVWEYQLQIWINDGRRHTVNLNTLNTKEIRIVYICTHKYINTKKARSTNICSRPFQNTSKAAKTWSTREKKWWGWKRGCVLLVSTSDSMKLSHYWTLAGSREKPAPGKGCDMHRCPKMAENRNQVIFNLFTSHCLLETSMHVFWLFVSSCRSALSFSIFAKSRRGASLFTALLCHFDICFVSC